MRDGISTRDVTVHMKTTLDRRNGSHQLSYVQVFGWLLLARMLSVYYNLIHDTDETYNYWEPLHFMVHGAGFQTWEYSPIYAIRSWAYILLHALPIIPFRDITSKEQQFYLVRGILGLVSAGVDSFLVTTTAAVLGRSTAQLTLIGLAVTTGMFSSSTALLPSSFTMYTSTLGLAYSLRKRYTLATVCFAIGAILGWPFSALLVVPLLLSSFAERPVRVFDMIRGGLLSLPILLFSTLIDYTRYHIWTIVPVNIVLYNVFSNGNGRGPDLFGTEPASYYFKNLLLNFNVLFPLALIAVPASLMVKHRRYERIEASSGFLLWFVLFTAQPHKEERFMYPIYPALVLTAAIAVESSLDLFRPVTRRVSSLCNLRHEFFENSGRVIILVLCSSTSIFRTYTMIKNYSAPLRLFPSLEPGHSYCIGSDWYRFPTSFLLPRNATLHFVESDFKGLLPGKFLDPWSIPTGMNDLNQWSADKVVDPSRCDFLISWKADRSANHTHYFLDRETGSKRPGFYGYERVRVESSADRLNRLGKDLFGRKLDSEGKRYEDGELSGAMKRDSPVQS